MPAVQYDYDYFEYGKPRKGSTKVAPRVSGAKKSATKSTSTRKTATKRKTTVNTARSLSSSKVSETRRNNRASIRAVVNEESRTTKRNNSKNLDVPNIVSRKQIQKPKEMSLKNAEVMAKPKQKAKKKENVMQNVVFSLFCFSVLFLICYRSSVINESSRELNNMEDELKRINMVNAQIKSNIQGEIAELDIESYAKYQLGMQKPKDSQIQRVIVEKEDKIATPVVIAEENDESFWSNFINDVMNILD